MSWPSSLALPLPHSRRPPPAHRRAVTPTALVLLAALWLTGPANWPLWRSVAALSEFGDPARLGFGLVLGGIVFALLTALLGLIVIIPWLAHASWHAYDELTAGSPYKTIR